MPQVLADKIWQAHQIAEVDGECLLYVDLHLLHEVSSPQAFEGLRLRGLPVRNPELTLATMDHNVPTTPGRSLVGNPLASRQLEALRENCRQYGIPLYDLSSPYQGIVHVIGPELGLTLPGMVVVCGDSHTSTHGALGALALGIGTSEIEQVLATQCLTLPKPESMLIQVDGSLAPGVSAKDLVLWIINRIGVAGGRGAIVEFAGSAIESLSLEGRMTICNMASEFGARSALVAPDEKVIEYVRGRPFAPQGAQWEQALRDWAELRTDPGATYDRVVRISAGDVPPMVTWGTTPAMSVPVTGRVPTADSYPDPAQARRALDYMGLAGGEAISEIAIDTVFIGSCTNARIEDLRAAAEVVRGRTVAPGVAAVVVPGSQQVKAQAEAEGLDEVFTAAGFSWRESGCSMCLGMNDDRLRPGERCASTSNRNFEGRQGAGGRTHLVSPVMAAAAALHGRFVDVRHELDGR